MAETLCPKCKNPNRMSARFCATCGAPLLAGVSEATPVPSDTIPLPSGTVLQGRYRIEGLLGKGGFGAVYRTWDLSLSRLCAVKENLDVSSEAQRQFAREATVLAGLNHPNLPRVTDHFIISGQGQYLVMDFVEGDDLISMVERHGLPPVEQTFTWLGQVMDALIYLHNRQPPVVHRDIKPANIRITPDSRAMLVDFGLVKASDPHTRTTLGARAVTPGYSPPEQYGQGHTDSRSDIYSLGATLYALVTGQDPPESVLRIGQDFLKPVETINMQITPAVGRVILRAMALSPTQRYQTVANLKSDLNAALSAPSGGLVRPAATVASMPAATPAYVPPAKPYEPTVVMSPLVGEAKAPIEPAQPGLVKPTEFANMAGQTVVATPPASPVVRSKDEPLSEPGSLRAISDQGEQPDSTPTTQSSKPKWVALSIGILLVGIVLALVALAGVWGWMDQTNEEEMQLTIDAGVEATRTAWAQPNTGGYLPRDDNTQADLLDQPIPPVYVEPHIKVMIHTPLAYSTPDSIETEESDTP